MGTAKQLRGARTKLQRAEEHLGQLQAEHERFISERNPYRMLREEDVEPGYYVWRVKVVEPPPLEKWGSLVGECIHSLRSALDHTAYELVRVGQPTTEKTEFPIFKDRGAWDSNHAQKLPGVPPKVLAQVKWLQPYRRAQAADRLWLVHELDIIDKHRRLNLVSAAVSRIGWSALGGDITDIEPTSGPFEDGAVVARFRLEPHTPDMRMQSNFTFDIAFGEAGPLRGESVFQVLESLRVFVVVARFDRFF